MFIQKSRIVIFEITLLLFKLLRLFPQFRLEEKM